MFDIDSNEWKENVCPVVKMTRDFDSISNQ